MSTTSDDAPQRGGKVYLVGAGPGDPGLMTLRGAECLRQADLILYDGLVNPLLLQLASETGVCERTARTRNDGGAFVPQQSINQRMIDAARSGQTVVRLKGGDPCIFGRGGEEAEALRAAGVHFEIVSGVTAATAAAGYAGFAITHRQISSAVAFVTGHEDPQREKSHLNYQALADFPGTLVFYMGLARLEELCRQLIECGKRADTPAAVVCRVSLPSQKVVTATLCTLADKVFQAALRPPSLVIVGDCVPERDRFSWFEKLPLFGVSVGITRAADQCEETVSEVLRLGGEPVVMPMIEVTRADAAQTRLIQGTLQQLPLYEWLIFTSVNGVHEFLRHLWATGKDLRTLGSARIAAIGRTTAQALESHGLRADLIPEDSRAEQLAEALLPECAGKRCLWLRGSRARDVLAEALSAAGVHLTQLTVYQSGDPEHFDPVVVDRLRKATLQWVCLSSPAAVRYFCRLIQHAGLSSSDLPVRIAVISSVTAEAATQAGLTNLVQAQSPSWTSMFQAICDSEQHSGHQAVTPADQPHSGFH